MSAFAFTALATEGATLATTAPATAKELLEPRSRYLLDGAARRQWQHSIPAVKALRYSITFRTLRQQAAI